MSLIKFIPLFPLIGFLINGLGFKHIPKNIVPWIGIGASFVSFVFTFLVYQDFQNNPVPQVVTLFEWINVGGLSIPFSFQIDELSIIMLFVVTGVGTLIHLYSKGYMSHDLGFGKFFAYLNLFLFAMLLLVMGANYLIMFIGWEGVGLCSYLLIGFWNKNTEFSNAARKAFIMNRIGDLGLLVGIFLIIQQFGTLNYLEVFEKASMLQVSDPAIIAITLALFVGAMGKSAQIPLFTWLPDAMAGPTPVSALIHAATMVTAGIYLVVRSNVLYSLSPETLEVIAWVGTATAVLAATIGVFQNDIKKVLAYSTVSQLGYMFIGLGVMAYSSGLFHVITHAFFKALLFLGAGSVIHAMSDEQDIRKMGGLFGKIKITAITFLIGTIAISGLPPFAGFFSKDEILAHVFVHNKAMWVLAMIGSFLTAFYMFRLFFVTFLGSFRGTKEQEDHMHESPVSMTLPLLILAIFSVFGGFIGFPEVFHLPHSLSNFLDPIFEGSKKVQVGFGELHLEHSTEWFLMGISVLVALVAMGVAYFIYVKNQKVPAEDREIAGWQKWLYNKYYIDETYDAVFVNPMRKLSSFLFTKVEKNVLAKLTNNTSVIVDVAGRAIAKAQNGSSILYLFLMCITIGLILGLNLGENVLLAVKNIFLTIKSYFS